MQQLQPKMHTTPPRASAARAATAPTPALSRTRAAFDLSGRVAIITGGAGLLGREHAAAVAEFGGTPILWDINGDAAASAARGLRNAYGVPAQGAAIDITQPDAIAAGLDRVLHTAGRVDILINNAAHNPPPPADDSADWSRLEEFPLATWLADLHVGLTGAFLCSQIVGREMARTGRGVILNIASDLALIAPDQRIYRRADLAPDRQPAKPVTYSVVKSGLIGLTRYLATYWAERGVRANALCPGGVSNGQDDGFVQRLTNLIPLGRMARPDEYRAAVVFLVSDAASYMTGSVVALDGGRTCW